MNGQELFVINRMLDEEETELTKLRQQYQDSSEWVKRQQAVVDELREKFTMARSNLIKDMEIQMNISRAKEESFKAAIDQQRERAALYPEVSRRLSSVDVNIETQMDLLEILQTKRGEVRLKAASDYRIGNIIPLNQPSISGFVGGSKRAIYLVLATIFGLVLGLIVALFLDNQDHRLLQITSSGVHDHLEIPVLKAISKSPGQMMSALGEGLASWLKKGREDRAHRPIPDYLIGALLFSGFLLVSYFVTDMFGLEFLAIALGGVVTVVVLGYVSLIETSFALIIWLFIMSGFRFLAMVNMPGLGPSLIAFLD